MKVYQRLAQLVDAMETCLINGNADFMARHRGQLEVLVAAFQAPQMMTSLIFDESHHDKLVLHIAYTMAGEERRIVNRNLIVLPSLAHGFTLKVLGKDEAGLHAHLIDLFSQLLQAEVVEEGKVDAG